MTYKSVIAAALALAGLGAGPALAQPFMDDMMPPGAVIGLVRASGFEPASRPVLQGGHYVLRAIDPVGTSVRIVVDAEMGEIVSARPLNPGAPRYQPGAQVRVAPPYGRGPQVATIPPGMERIPPQPEPAAHPDGAVPPGAAMPPQTQPGPRAAAPSAPAPGATPLPRSRPLQAAKATPEGTGEVQPTQPATPGPNVPAVSPEHSGPVPSPAASEAAAAGSAGSAGPAAAASPPSRAVSHDQTATAPAKPAKPAVPVMPPVQPLEE